MDEPIYLKSASSPPARGPDPAVSQRVSEMLLRIERHGADALRAYSRELDGWDPPSFEVGPDAVRAASAALPETLKRSIAFAQTQIRNFAQLQRATLTDFEAETLPGVFLGQRQVPIASVGSYCPSGRVPMLACAFMTVLVPKVAGVGTVSVCSPPREGSIPAPTLHAIATSGADRIFALGGVQALAAMAFGIEGIGPVDMIVGPGNAFVAEAKRQLFGRVGIDLLAGPSEVAVIADDTADPELVAADLLAQAEHGPSSPAVLITTSEAVGRAVIDEIGRQLEALEQVGGDGTPRRAWAEHGVAMLARDREHAAALADAVATEHLEVHTAEDAWYFERLRNYGSIFLGSRATVAFSDKAIGTNHTLPTGRAARYTGGLSVAKFLKTLTYQRIDSDEGVRAIAPHVAEISRADLMPAHEASAVRRLDRVTEPAVALAPEARRVASPRSSAILEVRGLSVAYGPKQAVDDVSLQLARGEIFGLLGPNGAGKTSTLSAIEGLLKPQSGTVLLDGIDIKHQPALAKARMGVQLQATSFQSELTIKQIVKLYAGLYGLKLSEREITDGLGAIGLEAEATKPFKQLSGGQQQRLSLYVAVVHDPVLLLLDEPTAGLDPQSRRQLWGRIEHLRQQGGSILLTTHSMEEAQAVCDRVAIIDRGTLLSTETPHDLIEKHKNDPRVREVSHGEVTLEDVFIGLTGSEIRD